MPNVIQLYLNTELRWEVDFVYSNRHLQVNDRNPRIRCELYSKLTINTLERRQWRRSGVFSANFEHFLDFVLLYLLLTLHK